LPPATLDAGDFMLMAHAISNHTPTRSRNDRIRSDLEQALRLDPTLVSAKLFLARALVQQVVLLDACDHPCSGIVRARELLGSVQELEPGSTEVLHTQAYVGATYPGLRAQRGTSV
jgi:hypothetical protein